MLGEMRRDGLQAGRNNFETVFCAKLAHGCFSAQQALTMLIRALPRGIADPDKVDRHSGIIQPKSARPFNAVLSLATRERSRPIIAAVIRKMGELEIPRDAESHKWLLRSSYAAQNWSSVLRNFLFLRRNVLWDVELADRAGFDYDALRAGTSGSENHDLDDDIARMVLEACEMIGLADPLARNIALAVLGVKDRSGDDEEDREVTLLLSASSSSSPSSSSSSSSSTAAERLLSHLSKRIDRTKKRLRGAEVASAAGGVVLGTNEEEEAIASAISSDFMKYYKNK
jgi:hypothetical protein